MKYFLSFVITWLTLAATAQDSIRYRVIFIGDAGEMNAKQKKALDHAAAHILTGKTTVMYLGDNIYPHGMGLPGSPEEQETHEIIRSQYKPMRDNGAPVYFIPGNHDWDKMGPEGLAKMKRQWQYVDDQGDSLLKVVPKDGCPDPVEINLTDSLTIIAFDSEWWLFPFDKTNPDADCDCKTKEDIVMKLEELFYKNRNKVILLASHHPFQSYGVHGGKFTLKDHIFPFTALKHNLYIPMPVVGSLYPFLRSTFTNPEDLKHPLYKDMIRRVDGVFAGFPNLVHVAGHEHGLQFIRNNQVQIVSGAGAKHTNASKGPGSLFADAVQGYVTVDLLAQNTLSVNYYIYDNDTIRNAFSYSLPYTRINKGEIAGLTPITTDSVELAIHPSYGNKSGFHKFLFGENYRKEWATPVKLPVFRLSKIEGGLVPLQQGGGMQSKSLRLADKSGKEWVIRSVEKTPDALLPEALRQTFARDWLDDVTSAQHPFSALVMPPLADAVKVPHANPVIGIVAPDKNLGIYERKFSGMVVLLEEREPLGESDNTIKMMKNLLKDNDNRIEAKEFLRARMLDLLVGDWDRHGDQWRWFDKSKDKSKKYVGVPRDRDQVFHLTEGLFPKIASLSYILPTLRDFDEGLTHSKWLLWKTRFVNAYPEFQFSSDKWKKEAEEFSAAMTDTVLEAALRRLPPPAYALRHDELLNKLKARRDRLPVVMDEYYRLIQKVADIQTSNKNELVQIKDSPEGDLNITIQEITKTGAIGKELMNKTYDRALSKEVRIFLGDGKDSVILDNGKSPVKLRIIGGNGPKNYIVIQAKNRVSLYDKHNSSVFSGDSSRWRRFISDDSLNTAFTPVNLYNILMPLVTLGVNADDGFILGGGFRYTRQEGFRKFPYASMQSLMAAHSFSTKAYRIKYRGEWTEAIGKADIVLQADIKAPNNTLNFFGRGNETSYDKDAHDISYYRTRYGTYRFDPSLRWKNEKGSSLSVGPSLYYYVLDKDDNYGRFITTLSEIGSYDSSTIGRNKLHLGGVVQYESDKRNNKILPQWGTYINTRIQAYKGVGEYAKDFAQIIQEVALYKSIGAKSGLVIAERLGGTVSIGNTAFYQSAFLGGQENLLGYRQYRFAGRHSVYNNLELRKKLVDIAGYILPGQLGMSGFWDIGRVWEKNEVSEKWHNGVGGGLYFVAASVVSFNFAMGYSSEGWYPYITMGFRF